MRWHSQYHANVLTWFGQALEVFCEQSPKCSPLWADGQTLNVLPLTIDSTRQDKTRQHLRVSASQTNSEDTQNFKLHELADFTGLTLTEDLIQSSHRSRHGLPWCSVTRALHEGTAVSF